MISNALNLYILWRNLKKDQNISSEMQCFPWTLHTVRVFSYSDIVKYRPILPIFLRIPPLSIEQSCDCPSDSEATP